MLQAVDGEVHPSLRKCFTEVRYHLQLQKIDFNAVSTSSHYSTKHCKRLSFCSDSHQAEKVNYEKFKSWLLQNKDAFTFSRWLLSSGVFVTLTDDSDTPTFYQTLAGVTHRECFILHRHSVVQLNC